MTFIPENGSPPLCPHCGFSIMSPHDPEYCRRLRECAAQEAQREADRDAADIFDGAMPPMID